MAEPRTADPRAAAREAADRTLQVLEDDVADVVAEALEEVAREFAHLIAHPDQPSPTPSAPGLGAELGHLAAQGGDPIDPGRMQALAHLWAAKLDRILGALRRVYQRAWSTTARPFTPDAPPPTPVLVEGYLRTARNRLSGVGDDLWAKAREVLADGTAAGESTDQVAARLTATFAADGTELGTARAERIARTEVVGSWNRASRDSVGALPPNLRPRYKTWLATLDRRTRRDHWEADGQVVALDGQFAVGGELLDYPGDPNGSARQTVNCRCVPTYGDNPRVPGDEGRQFLTAAEIARLDRERPGRGGGPAPDVPLAASNLTTDRSGAAGCRAGPTEPNHREREMPTQLDTVIATVLAGGRWTAAEVAAETGVPVPTVRTYLARAAEMGKLRREGRGVYMAAATERTWSTPAPAALWFEDEETGDGRIFGAHALFWETGGGGWPLQYADEMLHGHDGAELAGPIRTLAREGGRGVGTGALYTDVAAGSTSVTLLERGAPLGVSVDLDDVSFEIVDRRPPEEEGTVATLAASAGRMTVTPVGDGRYRVWATHLGDIVASCDCAAGAETLAQLVAAAGITPEAGLTGITAAAGDPDSPDDGTVVVTENSGDVLFRITRGRVRGATLVSMPAFSRARIVLDDVAAAAGTELSEVVAAVEGDTDLPVHPDRAHPWDGPAAQDRVFEWATDDDGNVDVAQVARAFLWRRPDSDPATQAAWALGFADVIDGDLTIIPAGVFACAGGHGVDAVTGMTDDDRDAAKARICTLYQRVADAGDDDDLECPFDRTAAAGGLELPAGAVRDDRTLAAAALLAANGHTGAMLALVPADPVALAVPGGDDPADLHVTLAYLGTAAELSDRAVQVARDTAAGVAYYHPPMEARVAGIGTLGAENPPATVLLLNGAEMDRARSSVWEGLGELGWEAYAQQHQPWLAHTTLGYGLDPAELAPPETVRFDRVRLALGDEVMDWPLTGPDMAPQDVDVYAAGAPAPDVDGDGAGVPGGGLSVLEASAWHELTALPPMPAPWFALPTETELPFDQGPVHYDTGRIWGWVARRGVPHESLGIEAPIDGCDLTTFLRATRQLDDGATVRVGAFTMNVGHHRDSSECETAQCAFDNTRTVAGIVTVGIVDGWAVVPEGDDDNQRAEFHSRDRSAADAYATAHPGTEVRAGGGMWFAGAAAPWLSAWDANVFAACAPSGHWRQDGRGNWSLRAVLSVPFPGYPTRLAAAAVIQRANLAVSPHAETTSELTTTETVTTVTTEVEAELGQLEWGAVAAAVVDEIERRQAARAEVAALAAVVDQAAGDTPATP